MTGPSPYARRTLRAGRRSLSTWKAPPDAPPMFWIYPRPGGRALQVTVWRRKVEFRWAPEPADVQP